MNDDIVPHIHVVTERELDVLERLEVLAAPLEDARREQPAETHADVHVLSTERRAIEAVPKPEQGLHALESGLVAIRVVLWLERHVARVECKERGAGA